MAVLENIPPSLKEALEHPPSKGERNVWLFTVAKRARHFASQNKIRRLLQHATRHWTDRDFAPEIERAIQRAYEVSEKPIVAPVKPIPPWPAFSIDAWIRRTRAPTLFSNQPLSIAPDTVLDALYPNNPLLCSAIDTYSAMTQPRDAWRGMEANLQFIVANPMTAVQGINQSGKLSYRCLDNATPSRAYQVVEFDRGTPEDQAAILSSLSTERTPLFLVVSSGGKSLHGWFLVSRLNEYAKLRFFRHAVSLGADASLWDPSKLVRMPGGRRDNGNVQHILHFKPEFL